MLRKQNDCSVFLCEEEPMFAQSKKWIILMAVLLGMLGMPLFGQEENKEDEKEESKAETVAVEMVVSASRKAEKKLEAPSTIETVTEDDMLISSATTFNAALANVKGVDFSNGGLNLQRVSARGFATSYQSRMLSMTDGRLATLPGAGVPQGTLSPVSMLDVKTIEVVLGPASALYGANASAGVINVITKNPWDQEGISTSIKGGEQSFVDLNFRYANILNDNWAIKLTGEYLTGDDFDTNNIYFANGTNQTQHTQAEVDAALANGTAWREDDLASGDVNTAKYDFSVYYKNGDWLGSLNYGWSESDTYSTTNLGRNYLDGWGVEHINLIVSHPNWYFQYSRTENSAGDSYGVQNVPPLLAAGLPFETIVSDPTLALLFDESSLEDFELQYSNTFGPVEMTVGTSYRNYEPSSGGTYLDDFFGPISRKEEGYYGQLDYRVLDDALRFTGAVRYDTSDEYDAQTSPKFGMTYTWGANSVRANYNKAHRDPSILENHLYFAGGVAQGNQFGWTVTGLQPPTYTTSGVVSYPAISPETVETIEVGYRGVLGGNFILDAVAYTSDYDNFISALQLISPGSPLATAVNGDGREWAGPLLTYLNYGKAEVDGFDIGLDYFYEDKLRVNFSVGHQSLKSFTNDTAIADLPYNTPEDKRKFSITYTNYLREGTFSGLSMRHVDEYPYLSGRWVGDIGPYNIFDFATGFDWADKDMLFKLSVSNLTDENKTELIGLPVIPRFITFEIQKKW
jgi:iron complex outermembrane receptor protein